MDYKFLNRVVDQLVSETNIDIGLDSDRIDYYRIYGPFVGDKYRWLPYHYMENPNFEDINNFEYHCKGVYGISEEESEYVWDEWRKIIRNKVFDMWEEI